MVKPTANNKSDNDLIGFKTGLTITDFDLFAAFTSTGGDENDAGVFRGNIHVPFHAPV